MWIALGNDSLKKAIEDAITRANKEASTIINDLGKAAELRKEISRLEIDRDKKQEEWSRREREVEHLVGLERKRQEFEITQAKRETEVKVREENLAADKERFKAEMNFQRERLSGEVESLRELVGEMLKRLPSAEIYARIGGKEK